MISEFSIGEVVCRGFLLKKNRWFNKQVRFFNLYQNGELRYYQDIKKYKGKITLSKGTKVLKTAKNQIEIPTKNKTYVLLTLDKNLIASTKEVQRDPD